VAAQLGEVAILGSPGGATVFINGARAGALPLTIPVTVVAGETVVTVAAVGYTSITRKILVDARRLVRETVDLPAVLTPRMATEVSRPAVPGALTGGGDETPAPPEPGAARLETPSAGGPVGGVPEAARGPRAPADRPETSDGFWTWQHALGGGLAALGVTSLIFGIVEHVARKSGHFYFAATLKPPIISIMSTLVT
jgi:PEGA domain